MIRARGTQDIPRVIQHEMQIERAAGHSSLPRVSHLEPNTSQLRFQFQGRAGHPCPGGLS